LDEVDDTSILKTGRPCRYRRSLSRSSRTPIGTRLTRLSRSDLVLWPNSDIAASVRAAGSLISGYPLTLSTFCWPTRFIIESVYEPRRRSSLSTSACARKPRNRRRLAI